MGMMVVLAMAAPSPRTIDTPRKAYSTCIKGFDSRRLAAMMDAAT